MKGTPMTVDWRTVQIFLGDDGVDEVEASADNYEEMRCTCVLFQKSSKKCRHTIYVRRAIEKNGGSYAIHLPEDVDDALIDLAMKDKAAFRELLIKYAPVEVL